MNFLNTLFARMAEFLPASFSIKFGADKALHFCAGAAIGTLGSCLALILGGTAWWGVALAAFFGILKEVVDYMSNQRAIKAGLLPSHGVEFKDALWTAAGGVLPSLIFVIFSLLSTGIPAVDAGLQLIN